jgi:hypothetical protein
MATKTLDSATVNWQSNTKNLVVYGNTAGTGSPVLPGLTVSNVALTFQGGTYTAGTGVPETVTVSIINYKHIPAFDLGKLTKFSSLSLKVDVKPSVTMRYLLNAASI